MSRVVILFPLGDYYSQNNGTPRMFQMDESLIEVLGQAKEILVHHRVEDKLDANSGATLTFFHSSLEGDVLNVGMQVTNGLDVSSQPKDIQTVHGPFAGRMMAVLDVRDATQGGPVSQKYVRLEIGATLIMD
jgi:hypothetical protein